ncbi:phosphopantetheine-binding protein [Actinoplanes sp. N902-109]|uniref:phosphopantetheine-binding protein n=1 Tax=Actinoplanes sp. (strain N902-109) TaxID=649831 RepID=UPI000329547D|nr:phosphopantetheine-binding protein [Actinoplanes sp. N902-109]AGL19154.1 hypothetical protein L083_5644 [Actinoplanes sp. N902-109]
MSDKLIDDVMAVAHSVLGPQATPDDNIYSLDGDSVTAVEMAARLEETIGREVDVELVVEAADFTDLARLLAGPATAGR